MKASEHTTCDVCGRPKLETNHWLVAITRVGMEGILVQPSEVSVSPRNPDFLYEDLCGDECVHKRISRWMDARIQPSTPPESEQA
jgi:hypothetical protein